jgi:hypothetical protein
VVWPSFTSNTEIVNREPKKTVDLLYAQWLREFRAAPWWLRHEIEWKLGTREVTGKLLVENVEALLMLLIRGKAEPPTEGPSDVVAR